MAGNQRRCEWAVLLTAAAIWLPSLAARDLWTPDEPRIAQVAEELRAAHAGPVGLVLPHLDGEPYTQKPPLYYWLTAALAAPFGHVSPWMARAPSALGGLASLALTMALARRLFGARYGAWAGLLLLTSQLFANLGQRAQLDALLTACELFAWLAWVRLERGELTRSRALALLHAALGAGMLVKGPVALLPLAAIAAHCILEQRAGELRALFAVRWLALSLGPLLAWGGAAIALAPAGFFQQAVVENILGRFVSGSSHIRPFYYYAYQLPLDFLPAALLLPWAALAAWRARHDESERGRAWRLISVWSAGFVLFFSLSAGKRGLYLAPALPALAIGCAVALVDGLAERPRLPFGSGWILATLAALLAAVAAVAAVWSPMPDRIPESVIVPGLFFAAVIAICGAAMTAAMLLGRRGPLAQAAVCGGAIAALYATVFQLLYPAFDPERSLRPVAAAAVALARPGERIGVVYHSSLIPALSYYSGGEPRRYEDLPDHAAIRDFLRQGRGQVLISESNRAWALEPAPHPRTASFRSADRQIWVLAPPGRAEGLPASLLGRQTMVQPPEGGALP